MIKPSQFSDQESQLGHYEQTHQNHHGPNQEWQFYHSSDQSSQEEQPESKHPKYLQVDGIEQNDVKKNYTLQQLSCLKTFSKQELSSTKQWNNQSNQLKLMKQLSSHRSDCQIQNDHKNQSDTQSLFSQNLGDAQKQIKKQDSKKQQLKFDQNKQHLEYLRFLYDLQFVQLLSNPEYLHFLANKGYFKQNEFINYLSFLNGYMQKNQYRRYIQYPTCLDFLSYIVNIPDFVERLRDRNFINYVNFQLSCASVDQYGISSDQKQQRKKKIKQLEEQFRNFNIFKQEQQEGDCNQFSSQNDQIQI